MPSLKPAKTSAVFVDRHGLWSADQARLAREVVRAIKANKLELVRFSFADQHGVLRGKTLLAADAIGALRSGVGMTTTLLA
jgi:glutamine synthetase